MPIKRIKILILIAGIIFSGLSCSYQGEYRGEVKISGSTTMLPLVKRLTDEYNKRHSGTRFIVSGGGTEVGIEELISGKADIATASRNLEAEEARKLAEYYGSVGYYYLIAKDAVCIYVNKNNKINNISADKLREILTCWISNWKQIGGEDLEIKIAARPETSGTTSFLKEHLLIKGDFCDNTEYLNSNNEVLDFVSENENSIGYGGFAFSDSVKVLKINGIIPGENSIRNDTYPLTRYLHFFTSESPEGPVKEFIDWVLSSGGQKVISDMGYISLFEISS